MDIREVGVASRTLCFSRLASKGTWFPFTFLRHLARGVCIDPFSTLFRSSRAVLVWRWTVLVGGREGWYGRVHGPDWCRCKLRLVLVFLLIPGWFPF